MAPELLVAHCPSCGHAAPDELEVLNLGTVANMRCEACLGTYRVLLVECAHCGAEGLVQTLGDAAKARAMGAAMFCGLCHRPCTADEDATTHGHA